MKTQLTLSLGFTAGALILAAVSAFALGEWTPAGLFTAASIIGLLASHSVSPRWPYSAMALIVGGPASFAASLHRPHFTIAPTLGRLASFPVSPRWPHFSRGESAETVVDPPATPTPTTWTAEQARDRLALLLFANEIREFAGWTARPRPDGNWEVQTGRGLYLVFEDARQPGRLKRQPVSRPAPTPQTPLTLRRSHATSPR